MCIHTEEELSFYVGDQKGDHMRMKSADRPAEDTPRRHAPQPTHPEPATFIPGDRVADLSAITKDYIEGMLMSAFS
jgi:hypothetical protein